MAEGMELKDFATPYDDIRTLDALEDIFNDSTYDTVTLDQFRPTKSQQSNIPEIRKELTIQMTNENINRLKTEIGKVRHDIDPDRLAVELHDLRPRILSKKKELYLITDKKNNNVKTITFGKKSYNAARITSLKDGGLLALGTLENALGKNDPLCKLLRGEQETSFTQKTAEQLGTGSTEQRDREIEELEELRKQAVSIFGELGNTDIRPSGSESSPLIEEIPRRLEQSKELGSVLTDEDRQTIVKYLDFIKQNYNKNIQLLNDIEFNKKAIEDAEKKLATEIDSIPEGSNKINELRKIISDSEANIQSSKQMLDQILAYNERQFEDINMRLKSKFTLREKIGNIFRKYGLTITAITLALGLVIDTIVSAVRGGGGVPPGAGGGSGITDKIKQSLKNFSNWLLEMSKKAIDNLPAIIGSIVSFLLKAAASVVGFLAEHLVLFAIALAFALYEAIKIGYQDIKRRRK
jgi:hypothetical protein